MTTAETITGSVITVLDVTYIAIEENKPAQFIGLWYSEGRKAKLILFSLDRVDMLGFQKGDKGTLTRKGEQREFTPQGN